MTETWVWVFNEDGGHFPGGVFRSVDTAQAWIRQHRLTGVLTAYPLDEAVLDWAIRRGHVAVNVDGDACSAYTSHIGSYTTAHQPHYHFQDGEM